jgi:hypothetical protein
MLTMNEQQAREILKAHILKNNGLHGDVEYFDWAAGDRTAVLDGHFSADELEAIAWWMRAHQPGAANVD